METAKSANAEPSRESAKTASRRPARAELIWDGKYDAEGRRSAPLRVALPFQTVETVNESAQDRQRAFSFGPGFREEEWRNRLIWGDKKYVPQSPEGEDLVAVTFTKEPSVIEHKAYRDTWGRGLESYLQWFNEAVLLLHELLHENGSLYVHLDWHVSFYVKAILDEVFGSDRFVNEIVWKRQTAKGDVTQGARHMGRIHESIFLYSKTENYAWNVQYTPYDGLRRDRL